MTTGKTTALTRWIFVGKVMSLLFNMLPRLVIDFLTRSTCLLISWLQSPSAVILEPKKVKFDTVSTVSPSISHEVICRWHHPYGRKWRRTKEPLDESERGEWKSWLKAQHSENEDHGIWSNHLMANRRGNSGWLCFFGLQKSLKMVIAAMELKDAYSLEGKLWPS